MKNLIAICFFSLFMSCKTTYQINKLGVTDSIEKSISESKIEILKFLKKNKYKVENKQLIFTSFARLKENNFTDNCEIFKGNYTSENLHHFIEIGANFVSTFIVNNKNEYTAKASNRSLNKYPDSLNSFKLESTMVEISQKNRYITYIQLLECNEKYIIGYRKDRIDAYQYTDKEMILIYSKYQKRLTFVGLFNQI